MLGQLYFLQVCILLSAIPRPRITNINLHSSLIRSRWNETLKNMSYIWNAITYLVIYNEKIGQILKNFEKVLLPISSTRTLLFLKSVQLSWILSAIFLIIFIPYKIKLCIHFIRNNFCPFSSYHFYHTMLMYFYQKYILGHLSVKNHWK